MSQSAAVVGELLSRPHVRCPRPCSPLSALRACVAPESRDSVLCDVGHGPEAVRERGLRCLGTAAAWSLFVKIVRIVTSFVVVVIGLLVGHVGVVVSIVIVIAVVAVAAAIDAAAASWSRDPRWSVAVPA